MMPPETPGTGALWPWPSLRWERDEVLREQVALLRQNFPMTLVASLATALGTMWVMDGVADRSEERRVGQEFRSRWSPYQ